MSNRTRKLKQQDEEETRIEEEFQFRPERTQRMTRKQFLERYPKFNPETARTKIQISIKLDQDVLEYFKQRAAQPNAAPYQTQINNELRAIMERESNRQTAGLSEDSFAGLLDNHNFIAAVAKKVANLKSANGPKKARKAA
jgi:uncharacterized protein (DUF4415 family)